ncbi:putative vacuolar sorting protein 39 domain 1 [Erysiphe necator]|uniref:Putative vacuolar sorting protein 39 domain 1 n=1 Tax=Uncinula necator TaxID=52586 RepID=A0A0B1P6G1_UNCNE|nr:putative vacuolar sorting protein 39 domain 1 [Erysiphe necator]
MMLSAYNAHPIIELKLRDKSKIESILAHGDRLMVGLNNGNLRIYRVNEPFDKSKNLPDPHKTSKSSSVFKAIDLLKEIEKFSTKAIEQLAIIKESNILISLSNACISIHDLHSFTLQEQLTKTKGVTSFATTSNIIKDAAMGIPEIISRLAVCVKRRLLVWSWHESEMEQDIIEIMLSEPIRVLQWAEATKVICGLNSGFVIVDIITKSVDDVTGYTTMGSSTVNSGGRFGSVGTASIGYMGLKGYSSKPLIAKLVDDKLLLTKDTNSLFITSEGKSLEKEQIPWQQVPEAIGYSYPYILALQSPTNGTLEVRNPETLSLLQSITLQNAKQLHLPPSTVSLAHAGKDFHVASDRCVWRMRSTDYHSQIDELTQNEEYDEAISILNMLEDALFYEKTERLREIKIQKAQQLFDKKMYQNAMDIFMAQDVQAPPERVIRLYPRVIAGDVSIFESNSPGNSAENKDHIDSGADKVESNKEENGSSEAGMAIDSVKSKVVNKIFRNHLKSASDTSSIKSFKRIDSEEVSDAASITGRQNRVKMEAKDLNNAVLALIGFLVQARNRMKAFLDTETGKIKPFECQARNSENSQLQHDIESLLSVPASDDCKDYEEKLCDVATLIDTTLFRSYLLVRPQLAGALFRIPNYCDPDVVNDNLLKSGRYNDLVDFFYGKKLHRPALELLKRFGMSTENDDVSVVLQGPRRTIGYLQNLPPEMIDLILEFAEWPLRADPELGMEIFIADTENAETLPRKTVLNFLQSIDEKLATRYLEHIISELGDLTPEFHNRLLETYLRELIGEDKDKRNTKEWKNLLIKLTKLMKTSSQYSLGKAFNLIPKDDPDFYEAEVVVLSNMGQHRKALEIYVFKTKDFKRAEEYCNNVYLSSLKKATRSNIKSGKFSTPSENENEKQINSPSIFHTLLSLYLMPPHPHLPNLPFALRLLSNHGFRLPASSTLSLIPDSVSVTSLESYFRGQIQAANSKVNESRAVAGLHKSEVVNEQARLLLGENWSISALKNEIALPGSHSPGCRNRRVIVSEDRVCPACHKRLANSVITVMPNDAVLHYGCLNKWKAVLEDFIPTSNSL